MNTREMNTEKKNTTDFIPTVVEKSIKGEDEPMSRKHPAAPMAFVWYSYPIALISLLLVAVAAYNYM